MKRWRALLASLAVAACGDEGPVEVGAGLLPADAVRTFEVILEAHQYMVFDTAFGLYSAPSDAGFAVIANAFDGAVHSHGLVGFTLPAVVNVVDTLRVGRQDTAAVFLGGTVRMFVDTLRSSGRPVRLALYRTAEAWDPSATWSHRVDTPGERLPWAAPGGTRGVLVDTATYRAGTDTVTFRIDSATIAAWRDPADAGHGALIVALDRHSRIRTSIPVLEVRARSTYRPDTIYTVPAATLRSTFIFSPDQPTAAAAPRVGGTHGWRTMIRLRDRLDTLSVPCPGVPDCRVRLGQATINHAGLLLQPVPPPAGFRPEADLVIGAYALLPSRWIPLQRWPLTDPIGMVTAPRTSFLAPDAPGEAAIVELAITEMIRRAVTPPEQWPANAPEPTHIALVPGPDPPLFGFGTFAPMPALRLVLSTARGLQLP